MIEKIDARLARLAARHTELSTLIQNAAVELAQIEGAHAHLTDLKQEIEAAEKLDACAIDDAETTAETATKDAKRFVTRAEAAAEMVEPVFPGEAALRRALAQPEPTS